jgi:putative multiple sugar transport system permease protein
MVSWHFPVWVVIPMVLILGILAGLLIAFLVAKMGIPSFVASLAGWLIYRGALLLVTLKTGTIIIPNATYKAIGNGYIPDLPGVGILHGVHKLTLLLGMLAVVIYFWCSEIARRKRPMVLKCRDGLFLS